MVLFDIDGTLISSAGAGGRALGRAWDLVYGIQDGLAGISLGGRTDAFIWDELYRAHAVVREPMAHGRFVRLYHHLLLQELLASDGMCLEGSRELVDAMKREAPEIVMGLLSGNTRLAAEIKLRHFGIWDSFVVGAFGDKHACRKELARVAFSCGETIIGGDLRGEEVLVIGDTLHDIECAHSIGARCLAVATGGVSYEKLSSAEPEYLVRSLAEVDAEAALRGAMG